MYLSESEVLTSSVSWSCARPAAKIEKISAADPLTINARALADAETRARQWLLDADLARAGGNSVWADECVARAARWKVKAAKLAARSTPGACAGRR